MSQEWTLVGGSEVDAMIKVLKGSNGSVIWYPSLEVTLPYLDRNDRAGMRWVTENDPMKVTNLGLVTTGMTTGSTQLQDLLKKKPTNIDKYENQEFLFCEEHAARWCQHIEDIIRRGADCITFPHSQWASDGQMSSQMLIYPLAIPVIPTLGIWQDAVLLMYDDSTYSLKVHRNETTESVSLGVFHQEGRLAMRYALLDYLKTEFERLKVTGLVCKSIHHGYQHIKAYNDSGADKKFASNFCLWRHERCYWCLLATQSALSQMSGPDIGPTGYGTRL